MNEENKVRKFYGISVLIIYPIIFFLILIITIVTSFFIFLNSTSENFQTGKIFDIPKGSTTLEISEILESKNFINSSQSFLILHKFKRENLKAGKYVFKEKRSLLEVYERVASGESKIEKVKITTFAGEPNFAIAKIVSEKIENIPKDVFLKLAAEKEGRLYPDTYYFSPFATEKLIIKTMENNFKNKTEEIFQKFKENNYCKVFMKDSILIKNDNEKYCDDFFKDIITIASLIENEAGNASFETKQHVSGVIYNRLEKGMLLQIDAVFSYIYGYHLGRVLYKHLKVDSPYNTYKYIGLPPGPIGNPTRSSIRAALFPLETNNFFYLTGKDGIFYYGITFQDHIKNKIHLR